MSALLVPSCGLLWGVAPGAYTTTPHQDALATFEQKVGRSMDIYHQYHTNDQLFPTADERAVAENPSNPHLLLLNWKPATDMTWADVADGRADSRIDREADYIKSTFPHRFFLTIWHEPENDVNPVAGSGMTATDFKDMFRHVVLRMRADGASEPVFVVNYMSYPHFSVQSWWKDMYPGDDVVDWLAVDAYNSGQPTGFNSGDFSQLMNRPKDSWPGFYNWATANHPNKPIMLAEWGVFDNSSDPNIKAPFYNSVKAQLSNYPDLKAMVYFDSPMSPKGGTSFDSTPTDLTAFRSLINSQVQPQISAG